MTLRAAAEALIAGFFDDNTTTLREVTPLVEDLRAALAAAPERTEDAERPWADESTILDAWLAENRMEMHELPLMLAEDPSSAVHLVKAGFRAGRASADARVATRTVKDESPAPHARYVVKRGEITFTATPCYGMHEPWWVPRLPSVGETGPIKMHDGDEYAPAPPPQEGASSRE